MLGTLPRALRRALILPAALALLAPSAAAAADELALIDKTEPLGPQITLRHLKTVDTTGWYDHQILTADLSNPAVRSDSLWAGAVAKGGPLSEAADEAGAVAGVNADFFDIGNSTAALGGQIMGGNLLKSPDGGTGWNHVGVGKDGIGRLVDMTLEASAALKGTTHRVLTLNAANGGGVPAGSMLAFTSAWGNYSRARGMSGATNVAEVLVRANKVVSVGPPGAGAIPADGFVLVGRDAAADAIRALSPGDDATLTYALKDALARQMQFTVGGNQPLVRDGQPLPDSQLETAIHPRTAIGFKDGGRTLLLVTADGRQDPVLGVSLRRLARFMADLGAETALNLDGGGSTTMVARPRGEDGVTVRNRPSDGSERHDPNGVGVFVAPGSGVADELVITPEAPRVFPGLHRTLKVKAIDDHDTPVATPPVTWTGAIDGRVAAPGDASGKLTVRAAAAGARGEIDVRVLGKLDTLELSATRLAFADAAPSAARTLRVTGRDAEGYTAPIELADLELDYDRTLLDIEQVATGLRLEPKGVGGTTLVVRAAGKTVKLPITIGVVTSTAYTFDNADELSRWTANGTTPAAQTLSMQDGKLKLAYPARRNQGISLRSTAPRITLPGAPLRVRLRLWSEQALVLSNLTWTDAAGRNSSVLGSPIRVGWNDLEWSFAATTTFPVRLTSFQAIETNTANQKAGSIIFDEIEIDSSAEIPSPPLEPLREDPLFSPDGTTNGKDDWTFATLSDIQFTAASPELAKTGTAALHRIRRSDAELVVLNGDITDLGAPGDLDLARQTLETGGCDLIPAGGTPDDDANTIPCYYVPGNHESYTASGQGTLDAWVAEFGRPYRSFDHKGTRFILLNSSLGTLRTSSWAQLPMLKSALDTAVSDDGVDNVMVFAHHPVDDPAEVDASQLGDRTEVQLIEKLLTDFRERSGKGVGMVGSHAQIVDVHRIEGVPYTVLPSSGKAPYGTPDRGGFTGWVRWSVDRDASAGQQWITADVRAFAQSGTLTAPDALEVGDSAQVDGSIVQPSGVLPGNRVVPLRYPMSVRWSGSDNLAFGTDEDAAKAAGKAAIFDTRTRKLTALRSGEVVLTATTDSMREYTGPESLAPVVVSKVIRTQVTRVSSEAPVGGTVPATLALTLRGPVSFGAFTPGVAREYAASTTADVVSTAGDAALTVTDPSPVATGHLFNGRFSLPQPLQGLGTVKTWSAPTSNEAVAIEFKQAVGATDALRTGAYSKSLTFTLSTTTP